MTRQPSNKPRRNSKKWLVYAIMVIVFLVCLWWIFAPSAADREAERQGTGFNSEIPAPRGAGIVEDKMTAYEQERTRLHGEERMNSLRDYSALLERSREETDAERAARQEREIAMAPKPPEYYEHPEWWEEGGSQTHGGLQSSASAHAELTGTLDGFFEEPETDAGKEEMAAEIERLNRLVVERQSDEKSVDDQLALMERSYQLAAKYTGNGAGVAPVEPAGAGPDRRMPVEPVAQTTREVVSRLDAPLSDAEFPRRMPRERNRGFHTVGSSDGAAVTKNTIAAVVHGDQTLTDGQTVRLRTVEAMRAGEIVIPSNTVLTGTGSLSGERLEIVVTAIEYGGNIIPVELAVHDGDGQRGVRIPGSMEVEAFKEIAGNMGQDLGTTVDLNRRSAGGQLLTDLGRGVIQGVSQYVSKKARQVKVALKAGHRLFLLPETNA